MYFQIITQIEQIEQIEQICANDKFIHIERSAHFLQNKQNDTIESIALYDVKKKNSHAAYVSKSFISSGPTLGGLCNSTNQCKGKNEYCDDTRSPPYYGICQCQPETYPDSLGTQCIPGERILMHACCYFILFC